MTLALASVSDVKTFMGTSGTATDAVLQTLLDQGIVALGNYCNRSFPSAPFTEYRNGRNQKRMTLAHYPVQSISSVMVDGQVIPQSTGFGVAGWSCALGSRALILTGYTFGLGEANVVISGVAGYGDDLNVQPWPLDLKLALIQYVVTRLNERSRLGVGSKTLAGEMITYDAGSGTSANSFGIPAAAKVILQNYMNTVPETGL